MVVDGLVCSKSSFALHTPPDAQSTSLRTCCYILEFTLPACGEFVMSYEFKSRCPLVVQMKSHLDVYLCMLQTPSQCIL